MARRSSYIPVVLIVDDEDLLRRAACEALQDAGCTTLQAEDTDAALVLVEQHPEIGVLFTDINMPGRDGLQLARIVHALRPAIHLVVTSGRERPLAGEIPDDGRFVAKPYSIEAVAAFIRTLDNPFDRPTGGAGASATNAAR